MSINVTLPQLAETLTRYRFAYLLTIGDDARPHVVAVATTLANGTLLVTDLGRRTRANVAARPPVTLVWPPANPNDYSLIVDGVGFDAGRRARRLPHSSGAAPTCSTPDHHRGWL